MTTRFRSYAWVLLAVLMGGGMGATSVHEVLHAAEREAQRAAHEAAHVHVTASDAASPQAGTPCPEAPAHLDCFLCQGLAARTLADGPAVPLPARLFADMGTPDAVARATEALTPPSRGPPARA